MPDQDVADKVLADWQAACRADDVLRHMPVPETIHLVLEVIDRVTGTGSPDVVLSAHASHLAAVDWHASGQVLQLQVGRLMEVIATLDGADPQRSAHVHTVLSAASAMVAVEAWRNRAEQDGLTGLRNRSGWEHDTSTFTPDRPIQYASIDLDGLKAINDGPGGHSAGDDLLRNFAKRLEIVIHGAGGSAYRYGGDEFSAVLPLEAGHLAEFLGGLDAAEGVAAFSYGVAIWPEEDPDLQSVVTSADRRMYDMKKTRKAAQGAFDDPS